MIDRLRMALQALSVLHIVDCVDIRLQIRLLDCWRRRAGPINRFGVRRALAARVIGGSFLFAAAELVDLIRRFWRDAAAALSWLLHSLDVILVAVLAREPKILQMHAFDVVKLSVLRIVVDRVWMLALAYLELFEYFCVSIIMSAQEAVLFAS